MIKRGDEMTDLTALPAPYRMNVARAIEILKDAGCTEIYLFGSLATGDIRPQSDMDIAVRGCPKKDFFQIYGKLFRELDYSVDLVDLDTPEDMSAIRNTTSVRLKFKLDKHKLEYGTPI
jgi:predicted nucleotidyltransferase